MPWVERSDFTASNGSAWPLNPGTWSHTTESGQFNVTETVQNNAGRHQASSLTKTGIRRHLAGTATAQYVEVRARWARTAGTGKIDGGLVLRNNGGGTYIYSRVQIPGSPFSHGVRLTTVVNTSYTQVRTTANVPNLNTTGYVWQAARVWDVGSVTVVQVKTWRDGTTEPDWLYPTSFNPGDGASDTGTDWARLWHVLSAWSVTNGRVGLATAWFTTTLPTNPWIDYDDFQAFSLTPLTSATSTISAQPIGRTKAVPLIPATVTETAQALSWVKQSQDHQVPVSAALAAETAQVIPSAKQSSVSAVQVVETAQVIAPAKHVPVSAASAAETARVLTFIKHVLASVTQTAETAQVIIAGKHVPVSIALSAEIAQIVTPVQQASDTEDDCDALSYVLCDVLACILKEPIWSC
jgi:hypothetical protein